MTRSVDPRIAVLVDGMDGERGVISVAPESGQTEREASVEYAADILAVLDRWEATR